MQGTSVQCPLLGQVYLEKDTIDFIGSGLGKMGATSAKEHKLLLVAYLPELIKSACKVE